MAQFFPDLTVTIPEPEQDKTLPAALRAELPVFCAGWCRGVSTGKKRASGCLRKSRKRTTSTALWPKRRTVCA